MVCIMSGRFHDSCAFLRSLCKPYGRPRQRALPRINSPTEFLLEASARQSRL
jgi:hypothetical protein